MREVYDIKGGLSKISLELVNKYTSQFEILKSHLTSSEIDQIKLREGGQNFRNRESFKKIVRISKKSNNKLENASQKFLNRYPHILEYIDISKILDFSDSLSRKKIVSKMHQKGPVVFYSYLAVVIL